MTRIMARPDRCQVRSRWSAPSFSTNPAISCPGMRRPSGSASIRGRFTAAIQLGSQRNFDYDNLPELIAKELLGRGVQLVQIDNPLARPPEFEVPGTWCDAAFYPVADYFGAIDLMITNAGYNSFHECVYGGIPAIFVPNESPEMDDQHLRATYAYASGLGLRLRASEFSRVKSIVDIAMSEDFRQEMRRRSARLRFRRRRSRGGAGDRAAGLLGQGKSPASRVAGTDVVRRFGRSLLMRAS